MQMNKIARDLHISIIDMQLKNLVEPDGFDQRNGQRHGNARPIDCVKKGMELFGWEEAVKEQEESGAAKAGTGLEWEWQRPPTETECTACVRTQPA